MLLWTSRDSNLPKKGGLIEPIMAGEGGLWISFFRVPRILNATDFRWVLISLNIKLKSIYPLEERMSREENYSWTIWMIESLYIYIFSSLFPLSFSFSQLSLCFALFLFSCLFSKSVWLYSGDSISWDLVDSFQPGFSTLIPIAKV